MNKTYNFPFGEKLKKVEQKDKSPKKAFVLGVYASAVHACWLDKDGKEKVKALAVASEPDIFWRGENAEHIINNIRIPSELGKLVSPKVKNLNGPSGVILDELFLSPLGLNRDNTWLSDLLPESRVNEKQAKAIKKNYTEDLVSEYNLQPATIPLFSKGELKKNASQRKLEILMELKKSKAETLILLGDLPIKWFLNLFDKTLQKLSDFGDNEDSYGKEHLINIDGITYKVIALCHPRNAGKLGSYSPKWWQLHDNWVKTKTTANKT
jgi:hypothetical protein